VCVFPLEIVQFDVTQMLILARSLFAPLHPSIYNQTIDILQYLEKATGYSKLLSVSCFFTKKHATKGEVLAKQGGKCLGMCSMYASKGHLPTTSKFECSVHRRLFYQIGHMQSCEGMAKQ
jgi:hypothetical protein